MPRTPTAVADRREQILEAAIRVFARKGVSRTINRDIAREAGITTGLIYYYFHDKEDLLQAIVDSRSPLRLMRSLPPQTLEMPPAEFLPYLVLQGLQLVESETNVNLLRIFLPEVLHDAELAEPLRTTWIPQLVDFFRGYYARQQELGHVGPDADPSALAQVTLSCLVGFLMRRQIVRDPTVASYSQQELATVITQTLLNGIGSGIKAR